MLLTQVGSFQPRRNATLYKLDEPRFSRAHDPLAALVLCGAHRADRVMIAGERRVVDGQPVGLDLAALIAEHHEAAGDFA
jgi:8-oxoguanine deaminase